MSTPIRLPPAPAPPKPGLLAKIQRTFEVWFGSRQELQGEGTTQTAVQVESPAQFEYQLVQLEYDRRAILNDVRRLMDDDPRLAEANQEIGRDCVGSGLGIRVAGLEGTPAGTVSRAQAVIDAFLRDTDLKGQLAMMFSALLEDGDLFLSPIVVGNRISRLQTLPAATIERLDNEMGQFADASEAFRQVDIVTLEERARFPLWQVNHIRHDFRPNRGVKYGRSRYLQVRGLLKYIGMEENDLVVRRRTRAPMRYFHKVGSEQKPGDASAIAEYKRMNSLDKPGNQKVTTDFYGNGLTNVSTLEGDARLGEIEDVKHLESVAWVRLGKPKGLMAGYGEDINRDVLDPQRAEYAEMLQGLRSLLWDGDGGIYSGLKALCDFALSLAGVNPGLVEYQPSWPIRLTREQLEYLTKINELRLSGMISHRTALGLVAAQLGIQSADAELLLLAEERKARQQLEADEDRAFAAGQTGSANRPRASADEEVDTGQPAGGLVQ